MRPPFNRTVGYIEPFFVFHVRLACVKAWGENRWSGHRRMAYTGRLLLPARMMLKNLHDLKHSIYLRNHGVLVYLARARILTITFSSWSVGRTSLPTKQKSMTGLARTPYDISETRSTICEVTAQQSREGKSCYEDLSGYAPPSCTPFKNRAG